MKHNTLTLIKREFVTTNYKKKIFGKFKKSTKTHVFYDFIIDGQPLEILLDDEINQSMLAEWKGNISSYTSIACPQWRWKVHQSLLGNIPGDLKHGRVGLYYCRDCFDIGCGIDSILSDNDKDVIRWSSFGWTDTDYDFEPNNTIGSFNFDAKLLTRTLGTAAYGLEEQGLREVLNKIDFLGVADWHNTICTEYDCIISDILAILHDDGTVNQIEDFLKQELINHFEITPNNKFIQTGAKKILHWWCSWPTNI